jgi:hypothetical protein
MYTNYVLQFTFYKLRIANSELQIANYDFLSGGKE